jgi:hypothetical protein
MSSPLLPEILDLVVGFLHDNLDALKTCCLISKSWVHRTRRYLFVHVEFDLKSHKLWKKTFPDPSNSPARYTRSLLIRTSKVFTFADVDVGGWIRIFSGVERLGVDVGGYYGGRISFVALRGLSPTLRSLRLVCRIAPPPSEIFDLVCSFPLLEDLALFSLSDYSGVGGWSIPSTSPKLTGCLDLRMHCGFRPTIHRLLELPSGLHFSKIIVSYFSKDIGLTTDLISKCSDTLEFLSLYPFDVGAVFLSVFPGWPIPYRYL